MYGKDLFLHHSKVKDQSNSKNIHEGQEVTFDVVEGEKGPQAINVEIVVR
ncbi:cold-shock protein [Clostridium putrefaciens]|nr:cold shock domain-containing protein [Clostridium putrefaciens]